MAKELCIKKLIAFQVEQKSASKYLHVAKSHAIHLNDNQLVLHGE